MTFTFYLLAIVDNLHGASVGCVWFSGIGFVVLTVATIVNRFDYNPNEVGMRTLGRARVLLGLMFAASLLVYVATPSSDALRRAVDTQHVIPK